MAFRMMSPMESGEAGTQEKNSNIRIKNVGALMWILGTCIWMIALQGLLLVIHRSGTSRQQSNGHPSRAEICVGITLFWTFQLGFGQMLAGIGAILSFGLSESVANDQWREVGLKGVLIGISDMGFRWLWSGILLLLNRVLITWYFHLGLVLLLDTAIPFWQGLHRNPHKALRKIELRSKEILGFLDSKFQDPFSDFSLLPRKNPKEILRSNNQEIHLERRRTDHPNKGERRLSWNIVVDKDALDEMKETLGPPGGFGELGFNVARDGVQFEAMGVGTSFNLMFKLRQIDENGKMRENRGRKKKKHK
jgi:hypothetical protein